MQRNPTMAAYHAKENRRSALIVWGRVLGLAIGLTIVSIVLSVPVNAP